MVTSVQHPSTIFIYIIYIYLYSGPLDFFFLSFRQVWAVQKLMAGLSLRAGDRGFSPATKRVAPGYFYWKIEEK